MKSICVIFVTIFGFYSVCHSQFITPKLISVPGCNSNFDSINLFPDIPGYIYISSSQCECQMQYTTDFGETWECALIDGKLKSTGPFYQITMNPFNIDQWYATRVIADGDNYEGLIFHSNDRGKNWTILDPRPHYNYIYFHPSNPSKILAILFHSTLYGTYSYLSRSTNYGKSFEYLDEIPGGIIYNPFNPDNVLSLGRMPYSWEIWQSDDLGETWTQNPCNGLNKYYPEGFLYSIYSIDFSEVEENVIYCSQDPSSINGFIFKSTDLGQNWYRIDKELFKLDNNPRAPIFCLDNKIAGRIYVSLRSGLYLTEDDGGSWRKVYEGYVNRIFGDNSNPRNIYLTTQYGLMTFVDTLTITSNEDIVNTVPNNFMLYQNYPNPFNPTTTIKYSIPLNVETRHGVSLQHVILKVYDILGREVVTLVNEDKKPGTYEVEFNAPHLASGVFIVKLNAGELSQSRKIMLLK